MFLDFAKAFDRVNHKILLHKLCNFGISGLLLAWCGDYLSNRKQRVVVDGNCSSWLNIPSGVPQGSILGPLINRAAMGRARFLIYPWFIFFLSVFE